MADRINTWVWKKMVYKSGVTNVSTTAAQALALSQGLCQDYAQIMISICRILGIPARYVSGHLLGEGGSHAWVEVLVPSPRNKKLVAVPYDPTNHCRAGGNYITIAVGRDYRDVSPTSGYYTAPYQGRLTASKQAGLVHVQLEDGMCLKVDDFQLEWACDICA
jgi:transglutaminase-like putative cysteine protease